MEHWRVGFRGSYRVEQWLQLFKFHFDQIQRLFRRLLCLRRDRGNLFAENPNDSICDNWSIINTAANPKPPYVRASNHRLDTRDLARLVDIDFFNAPVQYR